MIEHASWYVGFVWNSVGSPPAADEIEVTVVGPGFGESTVIHLGDGRWLIVDSCLDAAALQEKTPLAIKYLRSIGVNVGAAVKLVIATHWHSDHVRGIGEVLRACHSAAFSCANALTKEEFAVYLEEMATGSMATDGAKLRDFHDCLRVMRERDGVIRYSAPGRTLLNYTAAESSHGLACAVSSLSPSDREFELFLTEITDLRPKHGEPKRAAVVRSPNLASVVVHVNWGGEIAALLGADMEIHHDRYRGWGAVVDQGNVLRLRPAGFYKIAHHGSINGHHEGAWSTLLEPKPIGVLTPFERGRLATRPPTQDDVARIAPLCSTSYATAKKRNMRAAKKQPAVERSLYEHGIEIRSRGTVPGLVRLRRRRADAWRAEVFSPGGPLIDIEK